MSSAENVLASASSETEPGTMSQAATTDDMIKEALGKLDPANDEHWTADGKPAMAALNALLPAEITRSRLEEVAPDFRRPSQPSADGQREGDGSTSEGDDEGGAEPTPPAAPEPTEASVSAEERIASLEADVAFLRKQFGWPTKDA